MIWECAAGLILACFDTELQGIVGRGAWNFAKKLGLDVTEWTREHTSAGGPFPALLQFDILVNAIRLTKGVTIQPFLTRQLLRAPASAARALSVVVDIACDVSSASNPLPIYAQSTTFSKPSVRVIEAEGKSKPLDVIGLFDSFPSRVCV